MARFKIPYALTRALDLASVVLLPPPIVAFTVYGYDVDWTDIGVVAWTVLGTAVLVLYTENLWWIPTVALSLVLTWAIMPSGKEPK